MLDGKRVVVLAGSSGIGAEVARQAAERGARVTITGRSRERLDDAASSMRPGVATAAFDATDRPAVTSFFAGHGPIDHLVSCVGFTERGTLLGHDEDRARFVIENKFWAQLFIVRTAHPHVARDGSIVLTGGTAQDRAIFPHFSAYSIIGNTMLGALVRGLAGELAPIRVNIVEPNLTETALVGPKSPERDALFERFIAKSPAGKIPQAADVARSYIHAMESGLINGDRLRPDGGPSFSEW